MTSPLRMTAVSAALAGVALALSGCAGAAAGGGSEGAASGGGASPEKITIGSLHPTSGAYAADGQQMDNAAKLAVDAINAAGGIKSLGGAQLELSSGDTQGKPEVAQSEANRLIEAGAVALIGTYQSSASANVAAVAERNKVPFVMDVSSLDDILDQGYTYTFRLQPNASAMGAQGADALIALAEQSGQKISKVGYLYEQGNFGKAAYTAFAAEAATKGITVDPAISYDATAVSDLTTQVQQVAASGADVLAVSGYYRDGVLLAQAVNTVKPPLKAVFGVADGAFDQSQFVTDAPNGGAGYLNANYHWDVKNPKAQELAAAYQKAFGQPIRTSAVESYDAVELIAQALETAGSTDPSALRSAIAASNYQPLTFSNGPVKFDAAGENTNAAIVTSQVQNGEIKIVYPTASAEASPVFPAVPQ